MLLNESNNGTASSNTTNFNPFGSLFGSGSFSSNSGEGNDTGLGSLTMVHLETALRVLLSHLI